MKEIHAPSGGETARCDRKTPRIAAALALSLVLGAPAALAQQPPSPPAEASTVAQSRAPAPQSMSRSRSAPPTARYEDVVSQRSFILDRSSGELLMKFDDSPEVYVLRSTPAQRGDAFLRSDTGQLMLRMTEPGNIISYLGDADGAPADIVVRSAAPLDRPGMTSTLSERIKDARERLTRLSGNDVTIFGAAEFSRQEEWVADAIMLMVFGVEQANAAATGSAKKLKAVRIARSATPGAVLGEGELVLSLNPEEGYAGRPSSAAIAKVIISAK